MGVSRVLAQFVARVIIANPLQVKAIAQAARKDRQDRCRHARLPQIWTPDAETEHKRRLVAASPPRPAGFSRRLASGDRAEQR
jgi:hypothetical protein